MNRVLLLFALFLLLGSCGSPMGGNGGGTEAGNAKIAGIAYLSNGLEGEHCLVSAIPSNYIPGIHSTELISRSITNSVGAFSLTLSHSDSFNLYIVDTTTKEQILLKDMQQPASDTTIEAYLKKPGTLKVVHSEISHSASYFYIEGMEYTFSYSSQDTTNDTLYIKSLPSVELPTLQLSIEDKQISISKTIIAPEKTVTITLDTSDQNVEVWNFSLLAGISKETMEATGNLDSLSALIEQQITQVNEHFNRDTKLEGLFNFSVDSIYLLTGSVIEEIQKPLNTFDYRVVYHGHGAGDFSPWTASTKTLVNHQDETEGMGKNLFNSQATGALVSYLGLARGCIKTELMEVSALNNPVSNTPYVPELSIMFKPDIYSLWCDYNRAVLNFYKDSPVATPYIESATLQSQVAVKVVHFGNGAPITGAQVDLFWVNHETSTVQSTPAFSGLTDASGLMYFEYNPYRPANLILPASYYTNCLIRISYEDDTKYEWMPILDLGEAYIRDSSKAFVLEVEL